MEKFITFLISTTKFVLAFPYAYLYKISFLETIILTSLGGILGVIFYLIISIKINRFLNKIFKFNVKLSLKNKKRILKLNKKYGKIGIGFFTPIFLSIPLGCFLTSKYYGKKLSDYKFLFIFTIFWSLVLSLFQLINGKI